MPNVEVPSEFFKKERNTVYSDWKFAFWRELFQNSVDAGSTEIEINLKNLGTIVDVIFKDNGCGMTRDCIDNVYFCLGKSTKTQGEVGGFGRARILTCFSMEYYKIETGDMFVEGRGAQYEVATDLVPVAGCTLTIGVDDASLDLMKSSLTGYLRYCNFDDEVKVWINGTEHQECPAPLEHIRDLEEGGEAFAKVSKMNPDDAPYELYHDLIVRVRGVAMYKTYISPQTPIFVDIDPNRSLQILTASRDNMHTAFGAVVDEFVRELNINTRSATRPTWKKQRKFCPGGGMIFSAKKSVTQLVKTTTEVVSDGYSLTHESHIHENTILPVKDTLKEFESDMEYEQWIEEQSKSPIPSITTLIDAYSEGMINASKRYDISKWEWYLSHGQVRWSHGGQKWRLLKTWMTSCRYAIDALIEANMVDNLTWSVGWYFGEHTEAYYEKNKRGTFFLLRPVDRSGTDKYLVRQKMDVKKVIAVAKHEVAHVISDMHNEDFANALTEIDSRFSEWDVYKQVTSIRI